MPNSHLSSIDAVLNDLRNGQMVIVIDDEDRENEGDLVLAGQFATPEAINFMMKHARGLVCVTVTAPDAQRLGLPLMVTECDSKFATAFTVSIDAAHGTTTGVSAYDRAHTIQMMLNPESKPHDFVRPGHVFPLLAKEGGVLVRAGHTEASVNLLECADLKPIAVICEIVREDGQMARLPDLIEFAKIHQLKIVTINQLIAYRMQRECLVKEIASSRLPTLYGEFTIKIFLNTLDGSEHIALVRGEIDAEHPVLVRAHSECATGELFGSTRCDCGWQLESAMSRVGKEGGVILYMRQEGRGIGLMNKIKTYALQDEGLDTVEANHKLGFKADHRDYGIGSQILRYLGVRKMRLLTNNPKKIYGLEGYGLEIVSRESIEMIPHDDNELYLSVKKNKMGHLLDLIK